MKTTSTLQFDQKTLKKLGLELPREEERLLLRLLQNELNTRYTTMSRAELFDVICGEVRAYREDILDACHVQRPAIAFAPEDVTLGAVLPLGAYPQARADPEPILWRVIEMRRSSALLLSERALDCVLQNDRAENMPWDRCSLRRWLNGTFLTKAFRSAEQALLESAALSTPIWGGDDALRTVDRVFCLAKEETELLLHDENLRMAKPTEYARMQGVAPEGKQQSCYWWLRTTTAKASPCAVAADGGFVSSRNPAVEQTTVAVRPAILLKLGAPLREAAGCQ